MAVEMILIRHGISEANEGLSSDPDCALAPKGLEQARQLARRLAGFDLREFVGLCSPYRRAQQTAEVIAAATGVTFAADEGVREWGPEAVVGGRRFSQESGDELVKRLKDFLRRNEGRRLLIVSHAAPISALISVAWGEMPNTAGPFWEGVCNCCLRWVKTTCA